MLTFSTDTLRDKLGKMPMAAVALTFIVGIVFAHNYDINSYIWVAVMGIFCLLSLWRNNAILVAVFALAGMLYNVRSYEPLPQNHEATIKLVVNDNGIDYGRYSTYSAEVLQYENSPCRARVRATADSLTHLRRGDIITAKTTIRPFGDEQSSYSRSMYRQGYSGRVTINSNRITEWQMANRENLNHWAVTKLQSLLPQSSGRDVAISIVLGAKMSHIGDIKRSYSYSGVSHLLAVSGLHVGIVTMLLGLLLLPLLLLWRGNMIRAGVIFVLIWVYVALCGYPTSAIRAAIMFSTLQLSHLTRNRYSQENSVCTAAFFMLAFEPQMLFELSFDLSFIAVVAIIFISKPINSALYCKNPLLREILHGTVISTACIVATMPLISNTFGIISTLSIFLTPIALVFAQIIIISSLLALVMPIPVAQILFRSAEWCADIQNRVIEWAVSTGIGYAEIQMSNNAMCVIYVIMALLLLLSFGCSYREEE